MNRVLASKTPDKIGQEVVVAGWINTRRDHGGVIFVDLRDHTGLVQLVFDPDKVEIFKTAETLRDEFCISAEGQVRERGTGLENPNIETGKIEIVVERLEILNKSGVLPIATRDEGQQSGEEMRLKYRFLDLRRTSMQDMIRARAEFNKILREYMDERDFIEVATPILANSSPEGARDFLIPSRVHPGKFYALPQAPQQFKQLLMVGGLPRYYQIAACFRDEDPRADRLYGEFYQLDLEMSFVSDGEVVRTMMDPLVKSLVKDFASKKLLAEEIPRIPYAEAMEKYGTDKPDLRYDMTLIDLTEVLSETDFKVFQSPSVKAICVRGGANLSRGQIDSFTEIAKNEGAGGLAYLTYEGGEIKSPIAKFLSEKELKEITDKTGAVDGDAVFFGADERGVVNKVLGRLRIEFANFYNLKNPDEIALCWITDFPFYEHDELGWLGRGGVEFGHNPFSMPKGGLETLKSAKTDAEKLAIAADQYDMVMNGYEVCSGAVRNHNPEIMYEAFGAIGYDKKYVEAKFGAMLNAFKYGAPPHAGCAFGLDRIFMILQGTENIRDVVAFPKNGSGVDVMMSSPSTVEEKQLSELSIKNIEKN
ncbi:MAG: aspartate--tRNA ligase [Candidatus Nomurabacteria bacterium]|jgi:aspartyl-tRNA synthetase|nr:aspartate--tRNA ligase [Candidatus Nomurabacteria bacterium]